MGLKNIYLFAYNLAAALGWAFLLVRCVSHIADGSTSDLWADVEIPLKIVQTSAALEIVHSILGFVRSPVMTTFLQVWSRVFVVWMVWDVSPESQTHFAMALACTSWSCVEVPRYLFYALKTLDFPVPAPLLWLRYSLFGVLYPSGITGEVISLWVALADIAANKPFTMALPNSLNFAFDFTLFCYFMLASYIPGGPFMFMHMVKQRSKILGASAKKGKTA